MCPPPPSPHQQPPGHRRRGSPPAASAHQDAVPCRRHRRRCVQLSTASIEESPQARAGVSAPAPPAPTAPPEPARSPVVRSRSAGPRGPPPPGRRLPTPPASSVRARIAAAPRGAAAPGWREQACAKPRDRSPHPLRPLRVGGMVTRRPTVLILRTLGIHPLERAMGTPRQGARGRQLPLWRQHRYPKVGRTRRPLSAWPPHGRKPAPPGEKGGMRGAAAFGRRPIGSHGHPMLVLGRGHPVGCRSRRRGAHERPGRSDPRHAQYGHDRPKPGRGPARWLQNVIEDPCTGR